MSQVGTNQPPSAPLAGVHALQAGLELAAGGWGAWHQLHNTDWGEQPDVGDPSASVCMCAPCRAERSRAAPGHGARLPAGCGELCLRWQGKAA